MTTSLPDWEEDLVYDPEDEYQSLLRALRRTQGFGLLFVECSPAEGTRIIQRVRNDLTQKTMDVLTFDDPLKDSNVYQRVKQKLTENPVDVLFIQGLEHSLYDYEDTKRHLGWSSKDIYSYSWKGVPPAMVNLNQQRENFRDSFNTCFVFLVPLFVIKYLIHRAPDFFDWRSGIFRFLMNDQQLQQTNSEFFLQQPSATVPKSPDLASLRKSILLIQALLDEENQSPESKEKLILQQASLLMDCQEYESAIADYDKALETSPDNASSWYHRGLALSFMNRYEEALESLDKALAISPDDPKVWIGKGLSLRLLGRHQEAIHSYDRALEIQPDNHNVWNYKGISLSFLGRYKEACRSYDKSLKSKSDLSYVWANRGNVLKSLGRYEDAIASYDKALEIDPGNCWFWFDRAQTLARMGRSREAIDNYAKVIELKPDFSIAWHNRALALAGLGEYEQAIIGYQRAIELRSDDGGGTSHYCLASALMNLGKYREAIDSYEIAAKSVQRLAGRALLGKAYVLFKMHNYSEALEVLVPAISNFRFDKGWREWLERRGAIELHRLGLKRLTPIWANFLSFIRFRAE